MVTRKNINADTIFTREIDGKAMFPHAVSIEGKRLICLSGQLAWDKDGTPPTKEAVLDCMDAFFECVDIRGEYFGPGFPCSTTVEISRLADPDAMIEIEVMAVVDS